MKKKSIYGSLGVVMLAGFTSINANAGKANNIDKNATIENDNTVENEELVNLSSLSFETGELLACGSACGNSGI